VKPVRYVYDDESSSDEDSTSEYEPEAEPQQRCYYIYVGLLIFKTFIMKIEPDKQINVTKFQMSCDVVDQTIPRPLPHKLGFFLLMCAKPGMGKTNLIL